MSALLRSAKFLRLFSGFARNFTAGPVRNEADNFLGNHKPQWQGIDTRTLSTQPSAVPLTIESSSGLQTLDRALQKLDLDIRKTGRISTREVEEIYEEVKVTGAISSSQSLLLIRCCGNLVAEELPEQRTQLAQNIWQTLQSIGVPMDISHYNALLRVYLENEHPFSPSEFLSYLRAQGVEPNRVTYQRLISRFCLLGDIEGATRILEHMKENGLAINEQVFNALVVGHARANDLESAQSMVAMMKRAHLEPSAETFRHLACAHAEQGDLAGVKATLEQAEREEVVLHDRDILEVIYSLTVAGHKQHLNEVLSGLKKSAGFNQEAVTVILRLVNAGHEDVGFSLLRTMVLPQSQSGEALSVGNFFIRQMVRARRPLPAILHYCSALRESGLNQKAVLVALHKALQLGELETAEGLLRALPEHGFAVRPHYFWPLIIAAKRNQSLPDVLRVLSLMRGLECNVGIDTLTEQVLPGLETAVTWDKLLYELNNIGVRYGISAPALCKYLLNNDQLAMANAVADRYNVLFSPFALRQAVAGQYARARDPSAVHLLHHMCQAASDLNVTTTDVTDGFLTELLPMLKDDRAAAVEAMLEAMLQRGLGISPGCAGTVQAALSDGCTDRCCQLLEQLSQSDLAPTGPPSDYSAPRPQQSQQGRPRGANNPEALDARLERDLAAARQNGEPVAPLLSHLLARHISRKRVDQALKVKQELLDAGEQLTVSQLSGLFNILVDAERLDEARQAYNDILAAEPGALSDHRVLRLARLMVANDKVDEAVQFLQTQPRDSRQDHKRDDRPFFMAAWRLLNGPAQRGKPEDVRQLLRVLIDDRYVMEPNRALLAMLVKAHLANNDTVGAMDEMERIHKEYRQLPWRSQMMAQLIKEENTDQLQRLLDLSMETYGEMDALYDLAFSFIECGKMRQAKKVLDTPGLRARSHRLEQICERYVEEGRIAELENLIAVTRDVFGLDRLRLYGHLLRALSAAEQQDRALVLWTQLQEEGLAAPDDMLRELSALLRRHGRPVPFSEPGPPLETGGGEMAAVGQQVPLHQPPPQPVPQEGQNRQGRRQNAQRQSPAASTPVEPPQNTIKSQLKRAIKAQAIDEALQYLPQMEAEKVEPSIHDLSLLVELLVRNDRMQEAVRLTTEMLGRNTFPQPRVFKFLMSRLSADGDVDGITAVGAHLKDELKSATSYDNRLCTAYLNAGRGEEFLEHLEEVCRKPQPTEDSGTYVFPAGGFLGMLRGLPQLYPRCVKLAENFAERGVLGAANMLWVDHFVNERYNEAQQIFDKFLRNQDIVLFRGVIEKATESGNLEMTRRLYEMLQPTKISHGAKAVVVSAVVNLTLDREGPQAAVELLRSSGFSPDDLKSAVADRLRTEAANHGLNLPPAVPRTTPADGPATADAGSSQTAAAASTSQPDSSAAPKPPAAAAATPPTPAAPPADPSAR
ncbi:leucine-rich PPR motif-containing protein, mitochondrial-like [Amphibalanus amphitrite]|uniref:leucine-rich PPR motif-containing protein, mitochondrial-like n=1 Tax=Amphibalanus amphitrite TaxID=1232801 RepID=UPI001C9053D1|nr:leucine-rich PPR motif-containing protein, mitochondrial-like [Amphibalanus amphitrite]